MIIRVLKRNENIGRQFLPQLKAIINIWEMLKTPPIKSRITFPRLQPTQLRLRQFRIAWKNLQINYYRCTLLLYDIIQYSWFSSFCHSRRTDQTATIFLCRDFGVGLPAQRPLGQLLRLLSFNNSENWAIGAPWPLTCAGRESNLRYTNIHIFSQ